MNGRMNELWVNSSFLSGPDSALTGNAFWARFAHSLFLCVCICEMRGNFRLEGGGRISRAGLMAPFPHCWGSSFLCLCISLACC